MIIFILDIFGTGIFPSVPAINQISLGTICYKQLAHSPLAIANPNSKFGDNLMSPTNTVCAAATSTLTPTNSIDYGLFSTYIIVANMTSQAAGEMNAVYLFEDWTGFAANFESVTHVCIDYDPEAPGLMCILPIGVRGTDIIFKYTPLAGYETLRRITPSLIVQANLVTYLFFIQLVLLMIILNTWPYFLAAGVILRSNMFTRRVGAVIIGITISMLLVFPAVYTMEYSASNTQGIGPIGVNNLPTLPLYELQKDGNVIIYGANSIPGKTGGYVKQSIALGNSYWTSSCPSNQYVYQFQCGNGNSTGRNCYASPSIAEQCPQEQTIGASGTDVFEGYIPASQVAGTTCRTDSDIYELVQCSTGDIIANGAIIPYSGSMYSGGGESCYPLSQVPATPGLCTSQLGANVNFFVLPNATQVTSYYSCMPQNLFVDEGVFAAYYFIPFFGAGSFILSGIGGLVGQLPVTPSDIQFETVGCTPDRAIANVIAFTNLYGIVAVSAYIVPLLNLIVIFSSAIGLSALLGGDTNLLGLGRLL